jgi:glycerol-3-phosphate acyltransferase PlsY
MREMDAQYRHVYQVESGRTATARLQRALAFAAFGLGAAGPCGGMEIGHSAPSWVGFAGGGLCIALALSAGVVLARTALVAAAIGFLFLLVFITAPLTSTGVSVRAAAPRAPKPRRSPMPTSATARLPGASYTGECA